MDPKEGEDATVKALGTGYRHIDSARMYGSEKSCGAGIRRSRVPREQIFVTSKVQSGAGYHETRAAIDAGLKESNLDYFDLYLIHAPYGGSETRKGAWRAMVDAQDEGKIRSIGVSNFGLHHLQELEDYIAQLEMQRGKGMGGKISVGQWELHPWLIRKDIVAWCRQRDIAIEAYCPLVRGQRFEEPSLKQLAVKSGKTPAQVLLRWSLQKGFIPLPKSITPERIEGNADIFDFVLSEDDIRSLDTDEYAPCTWDPTVSSLAD
jgi:diketogulonate reductase-like aldo/keto reductase